MRYRLLLLLVVGMWTSLASLAKSDSLNAETSKLSDVRVIIDISGSMKKNDPNNLRVPALRLLTELIPEGQTAGVWTFGKHVNMLVKHGPVDKAWKDKAYNAAKEINSRGMFTNIESVLEKSTWDWNRPDASSNRSIIFLTDGVVDLSTDRQKNKESRQRVLNEILLRLKKADVQIHTIALSDEADKPFLRQLSSATGGWFETIKDASQLERVFFKMFEKSVPVETLPLTDNKVLVDDSIRELTLLIFRDAKSGSSSLIMPDGKMIAHDDVPDNVRWRHEDRYDLITIEKPMAGEWQVSAELDPDNRVMVVTDLKVRASRVPNLILSGDELPYYVELHEEGRVINKPEFLDFVHVGLERFSQKGEQNSYELNDQGREMDKKAGDGRFSTKVGGALAAGIYEYEMQVDGMTFKRSKRDTLRVVEKPVAVTVTEEKVGDPALYSLSLTPFAELLDLDSMLIDANISKQGGASRSITIPRSGPNEWRMETKVRAGEVFNVSLAIEAERHDGRSVSYDLGSFQLGTGSVDVIFDEPEEPSKVETKPTPQPSIIPDLSQVVIPEPDDEFEMTVDHVEKTDHSDHDEMGDDHHVDDEKPDWLWVILKVVLLNGVLIGAGFFAYRKWFRKKKDDAESGDESLEEEVENND